MYVDEAVGQWGLENILREHTMRNRMSIESC